MRPFAKTPEDTLKRRIAYAYIVASVIWSTVVLITNLAYADSYHRKNQVVVSLPSDIAGMLRERNHGGRGGCSESNIFVHGFRYLGMRLDRAIWFLGAPDYLCETNSFISVIATPGGEWTLGQTSEEDWEGSRMLAGAPVLFQHSSQLGYFLTSEWQAEAPIDFMYHSSDGESWTSVSLPVAERKNPDGDCCNAATIDRLCVDDSKNVFVSYLESDQFHGSVWSSNVDKSFPGKVDWARRSILPDYARCDGVSPNDFIPRSLREKTSEGAVFEVSIDWAVRIPGATK